MSGGYLQDLAYIHDAGFTNLARSAAAYLTARLSSEGHGRGLVVDLGCGSGALSGTMAAAGYGILGIDLSPAMMELARSKVPNGTFRCQSILEAEIPPCIAVAAIGEVFNYLFDESNSIARLRALFERIHNALAPNGVFLFDVAEPGRAGANRVLRGCTVQEEWACFYEAREYGDPAVLTRQITTFRRQGDVYRRSDENHRLCLLRADELAAMLESMGFHAELLTAYGDFTFPGGWRGLVAVNHSV